MSKYQPLWTYILDKSCDEILLTFDEISNILGFDVDHSFLSCKKELLAYGFEVGKISLKNKTLVVHKMGR